MTFRFSKTTKETFEVSSIRQGEIKSMPSPTTSVEPNDKKGLLSDYEWTISKSDQELRQVNNVECIVQVANFPDSAALAADVYQYNCSQPNMCGAVLKPLKSDKYPDLPIPEGQSFELLCRTDLPILHDGIQDGCAWELIQPSGNTVKICFHDTEKEQCKNIHTLTNSVVKSNVGSFVERRTSCHIKVLKTTLDHEGRWKCKPELYNGNEILTHTGYDISVSVSPNTTMVELMPELNGHSYTWNQTNDHSETVVTSSYQMLNLKFQCVAEKAHPKPHFTWIWQYMGPNSSPLEMGSVIKYANDSNVVEVMQMGRNGKDRNTDSRLKTYKSEHIVRVQQLRSNSNERVVFRMVVSCKASHHNVGVVGGTHLLPAKHTIIFEEEPPTYSAIIGGTISSVFLLLIISVIFFIFLGPRGKERRVAAANFLQSWTFGDSRRGEQGVLPANSRNDLGTELNIMQPGRVSPNIIVTRALPEVPRKDTASKTMPLNIPAVRQDQRSSPRQAIVDGDKSPSTPLRLDEYYSRPGRMLPAVPKPGKPGQHVGPQSHDDLIYAKLEFGNLRAEHSANARKPEVPPKKKIVNKIKFDEKSDYAEIIGCIVDAHDDQDEDQQQN